MPPEAAAATSAAQTRDEDVKTLDGDRSITAPFINLHGLDHRQHGIQDSLETAFFIPAANQPPIVNQTTWGATIFSHPGGRENPHDQYLRSGAVSITVPARQEEPRIGAVLDYVIWRLGGPDRVLAVIAPPPEGREYDNSYGIAEKAGVLVVLQDRVLECIDGDKINRLLGIPWPPPPGKGHTLLAASILRFFVQPERLPPVNNLHFLGVIDSDIQQPGEFDVLGFLGEIAFQKPKGWLQVRAARGGRGNETVEAGIQLLGLYRDRMSQYYRDKLWRFKWPLTGQHLDAILAERYRMHAGSYSVETMTNLSMVDLERDRARNPHKRVVAQVDVPTRCLDPGNDPIKEQGMMYIANAVLHTVVGYARHKGIWVGNLGVADFKEINRRIQMLQEYVYIPVVPGPNQLVPARPDYLWPSITVLEQERIIIPDKIDALRAELGRRWPGVTVPQVAK